MARRRIKAAKITHISLVPRGANRMPVIFKADDQSLDVELLIKTDDSFMEKGEVTALVYAPEQRDTQGDIASAEVIKTMMYDAARDGVSIDVRHDGAALNKTQAYVAESFLVQKGDPRFEGIKTYDGTVVDPMGSWGVVLKIDDPVLRKKYRDGEWTGVSMGGTAEVVSEKSDDMAEQVIKALTNALGISPNTEDIDMTKDELTAALKESNEALAKSIVEGVAKAMTPKKEEPAKKEDHVNDPPAKKKKALPAPIFKGDMTNSDDILAHQRRVALFDLRKDVDWADGDSVAEYAENLLAFKEEFGDLTDEDKGTVTGKPKKPKTNQTATSKEGEEGVFEGVSKEDVDLAKIGSQMADWANKERNLTIAAA
jgi:hypothetical protein